MMDPTSTAAASMAGRRRSRVALQATAALLLCGAAVLGINESYSKSSPNTSQNLQNDPLAAMKHGGTLRSLKVETIEPGRKLHSNYLSSHLQYNPFPNTQGKQCEAHYSPRHDDWIEPTKPVPVPHNSKFALNNNFHTMVDYNGLNVLIVGDSVGENMALFLANAHRDAGMNQMSIGDRIHFAAESNLEGKTQDKIWVNEVPEDRGGGYVAFGRVLRLWHGDEMDLSHEDFVKWDPTMFASLQREYGNVDVLVYRTPWPW